jgi:hypothetical protein
VELPVAVALAVVGALITLVLCDLAGGIARAKGRSYWAFFALGLLLWFPGILAALALPDPGGVPAAPAPGRTERVLATALAVLGAIAVAAGIAAAIAYAP